jgi:hypothetical protein
MLLKMIITGPLLHLRVNIRATTAALILTLSCMPLDAMHDSRWLTAVVVISILVKFMFQSIRSARTGDVTSLHTPEVCRCNTFNLSRTVH